MSNGKDPNGGRNSVLLSLAGSGNQMVQLGTLAAVVIGGLGSFFQTNELSAESHRDRERAVKEIHYLYEKLNGALENQNRIMESNSRILEILREGQVQFLQRQQREFPQYPTITPKGGQ